MLVMLCLGFVRTTFAVDSMPVAMWIERDNGDTAYYKSIVDYAMSLQPLQANKLLLRLADPDNVDSSISSNFKLTPTSGLIQCIRNLGDRGFTGAIALIPDFGGGQEWTWVPENYPTTNPQKWMKAYLWAQSANAILASNSCALRISEVTIEAESSDISADVPTLTSIRSFQATLWPTMQADANFIGSGMAHGFTNLAQMSFWTCGDANTRLLDAAYCELYNMYKTTSGATPITYVDAYEPGQVLTNPSPVYPETIYTLSQNLADPIAAILATPTVSDVASNFGFFVGSHSSFDTGPDAQNMCGDLSRTYVMFSCEKIGVGGSLIDAFGNWNAPVGGPGAGVDEFIGFCKAFSAAFKPFWQIPAGNVGPNICVFQFELLPATWKASLSAPTPNLDGLVMWDYREGSSCANSPLGLSGYHDWLLTYLARNSPSRLVLYVTDPQQTSEDGIFYDPTAAPTTSPLNFVGFLKAVAALPKHPDIEVIIDRSSYLAPGGCAVVCQPVAGWQPPLTNPPACIKLPESWQKLPLALSWFTTLCNNSEVAAAGVLKGITIDPELTHSPSCGDTGSIAYQNIVCWLDWAKRQSTLTQSLRIGLTVEVDAHTFAKLNTMTFPAPVGMSGVMNCSGVSPDTLCGMLVNGFPSWRAADSHQADPLLDSVYMQAYVACATGTTPSNSAYYRWMAQNGCTGVTPTPVDATTSAAMFGKSLIGIPYAPGTGTITITATNPATQNQFGSNEMNLNGVGTDFTLLEEFTRISTPTGTDVWKLEGTSSASTSNPATASAGLVYGSQAILQTPSPWVFTELPMNWQVPPVSVESPQRIFFLFSAEHTQALPFMGYWTLENFQNFFSQASSNLNTSSQMSIYQTDSGAGIGVPKTNYGIYSLKQACNAWPSLGAYPGGECAVSTTMQGDFDGNGRVDHADLVMLLMMLGTPEGDLDGDGDTTFGDLSLLLLLFQ